MLLAKNERLTECGGCFVSECCHFCWGEKGQLVGRVRTLN